jgi:hypothetical protein
MQKPLILQDANMNFCAVRVCRGKFQQIFVSRGGPSGGLWRILLQKSKIERPGKSRESRFLDAPTAARLSGANTKVGGRFGMKRCGPSCRRARSASAVLKNLVRQPKKTFATKSAQSSRSR